MTLKNIKFAESIHFSQEAEEVSPKAFSGKLMLQNGTRKVELSHADSITSPDRVAQTHANALYTDIVMHAASGDQIKRRDIQDVKILLKNGRILENSQGWGYEVARRCSNLAFKNAIMEGTSPRVQIWAAVDLLKKKRPQEAQNILHTIPPRELSHEQRIHLLKPGKWFVGKNKEAYAWIKKWALRNYYSLNK